MDKELDINEVAFTIEVDEDVLEEVRLGEVTHIALSIDDENQNLVLENIDGHLILCSEKMPETFHRCYWHNNGEFPYMIKETLQFLILANGDDSCLVHILSTEPEVGPRFRFQGPDKPSVEDPNGDSCIWQIVFEIKPVTKTYLLRWNPAISSFRVKDYEYCVKESVDGTFPLNWSIYEWEEAKIGDTFYMMRVGDDKAGIVFQGKFTSNPYTGEDWAGTSKQRHYVDLFCTILSEPGEKPAISLEELQEAIPDIEWGRGHSGILLPIEIADKMDKMVDKNNLINE